MIHFVFSRAFRDSLLNNGLPIQSLPSLIFIGTGLSLCLSFVLSRLFRKGAKTNIVGVSYIVTGACEAALAFAPVTPELSFKLFYILVSASTAIGMSMVWLLANNWISTEPEIKAKMVPALLMAGTIGGLLGGFGIVHMQFAESFRGANLLLAGLNIFTAALVSLHYEPPPTTVVDTGTKAPAQSPRIKRARLIAITLAAATVLGATGSTLLDLTYRIVASQQYASRTDLLHFFGYLQAMLGVAAVVAQLLLSRCRPCAQRRSTIAMYGLLGAVVAVLGALVPSFALLTAMRTGEYAMRNSLFRFGTEMSYAELPQQLRLEVRPLIDVVGERIGDSIAALLLQSLFWIRHGFSIRLVLICLSIICIGLWKLTSATAGFMQRRHQARYQEEQPTELVYATTVDSNVAMD